MTNSIANSANAPTIWALLVGIDRYRSPTIRPLKGCVNDVRQMRQFLVNQMAVPEDHIRVLENAEATRINVIDTFHRFLIDNPAILPGAQILVHYSGHGSQMPSRSLSEADGLDETIVVHDARTQTDGQYIFDIPDKTLAALLERLSAAKGDNITVILDCCHSGSGTRAGSEDEQDSHSVRKLAPDVALPPDTLDADVRLRTPVTPLVGRSAIAIRTRPNHVLIAGCRDMELSHELTGRDAQQHGALTYYLLDYLMSLSGTATYADLHEHVAAKVSALFRNQMPVCEGQRDRVVFGGATIMRDPFITTTTIDGDRITLDAGVLLPGLGPGAVLKLYPPDLRHKDDLARLAPIAVADIVTAGPTSALAQLRPGGHPVVARSRAVIEQPAYSAARQTVSVLSLPDTTSDPHLETAAQVAQALETSVRTQGSAYLDVVSSGADLNVVVHRGQIYVRDVDGTDVIEVLDASNVEGLVNALMAIARWHVLLQMANPSPESGLQARVTLRLMHYVAGGGAAPLEASEDASDGITLSYDPGAPKSTRQYVLALENKSAVDFYPHVLILNPDYSITPLYPPQGRQSKLLAGRTMLCGIDGESKLLNIYLHPDWDSDETRLLCISSTEPLDPELFSQDGLQVPPPTLAARAVGSPLARFLHDRLGHARSGVLGGELEGVDWGTALLAYRTVRASQIAVLPAGRTSVALAYGITLTKAPAQTGTIRIETQTGAQTGASSRDAAPSSPRKPLPPGLAAMGEAFSLVGLPPARGSSLTGLVLTLSLDEQEHSEPAEAGPAQPLTLDLRALDSSAPEDLVPVVFDGEDYIFVPNHSQTSGIVSLTGLPRAKAPLDGTDTIPTQRGAANALRLFIFKKLGRYLPELGLKRVISAGGEVKRVRPKPDDFKPGDRAVLFVHGFTSDTRWMSSGIAPQLSAIGCTYDHILTFDYESFGTSVDKNGEALADALRSDCGFSPSDGVHLDVIAHSMGCLVSRCMIELHAGQAFVDRLVIAGPPNKGTTLATVARAPAKIAEFLLDILLSGAVPGSAAVAAGLLKAADETGLGFQDIQAEPLSATVEHLDKSPHPATVKYLVLAGIFDLASGGAQQVRLARLARKVLGSAPNELFFGEPNDLVIGQHSMENVRQAQRGLIDAGLITVAHVPCSHAHYFAIPETFAALKAWL